jgi:PTS system mannitol-specific IIC component
MMGRFLSRMVMPNIAAFIAWGIITALFHPSGWLPNPELSQMIDPMIRYALPLLIAFTGGKVMNGTRGGVVAVVATTGLIAGSDIPVFMGAMIIAPLAGWLTQKMDGAIKRHIPMGFEMLITNFSAGILAAILAVLSYKLVGPMIYGLTGLIEAGVGVVLGQGLLFMTALFIEPGKILFLNNALNHGVFSPLGIQAAANEGRSIFFLLETNPGPGLGVLLAYAFAAKGQVKQSAPTAAVIHFFGGIHELYFPYVLMNPLLFVAVILGGMTGIGVFELLGAGLVATPSPGSIFAILALSPKSVLVAVILGIVASAAVSFISAVMILSFKTDWDLASEEDFQEAELSDELLHYKGDFGVSKIYFACDAGMGSSAMGASLLSRLLMNHGIELPIENVSMDDLPKSAEMVVTYVDLMGRARKAAPLAYHMGVRDFLDKSHYERLIQLINTHFKIKEMAKMDPKPNEILMRSNIKLNLPTVSKTEAIRHAGRLLCDSGYVEESYIEGMLAREEKFSTYIGNGVAIPHGENSVKEAILTSGIVVIQYPEGIDFGEGKLVKLVIGIAGKGNEHIQILANLAEAIEDQEVLENMFATDDVSSLYELFSREGEL